MLLTLFPGSSSKPLAATIRFADPAAGNLLPRETTIKPLTNQSAGGTADADLLLGTFAGTLPGSGIVQKPGGYVLLRLVRRGDQLSGTMIAYAAPEGLRHLYPFPVTPRRNTAPR